MDTLSKNKIDMINMYVDGKNVADIARNLGKSRQCIYNWLNEEAIILEIDKQRSKYNTYLDNIEKLTKSKNETVALKANMFLLDLSFNNS